jgi:hypothetical protein
MKRTACALLCLALPCLAVDRIVELRAKDGSPATYHVPEGRLVSLLGRSFGESSDTRQSGFEIEAVLLRDGKRFTNEWHSFEAIGNTVAGPAELRIANTVPFGLNKETAFVLLREWEPVKTEPATASVVPAGSSAVLTLETSSDLSTWMPAIRTNLPAAPTNRFFRLRLERAE